MNRLQLNSTQLAQIQQWANQESEIQHLTLNVLALRGDTVLNELPEFSNPPSAKLSAKSNNAQTTSRSINNSLSVYTNPTTGLIKLSFGKSVKGGIAESNVMGQWLSLRLLGLSSIHPFRGLGFWSFVFSMDRSVRFPLWFSEAELQIPLNRSGWAARYHFGNETPSLTR